MSEREYERHLALLRGVGPTPLSPGDESARRTRIVSSIERVRASLGEDTRPAAGETIQASPRSVSVIPWRRVVVLALPMAAAVTLWLSTQEPTRAPLLTVTSGEIVAETSTGAERLGREGRWEGGDVVNVATQTASASVVLPSRAGLFLDPGTRASVERATESTARSLAVAVPADAGPITEVVRMTAGSVRVTATEPGERTIVVITRRAQVVVRGTLFAVLVSDSSQDAETQVTVSQGEASVSSNGRDYRLTDGDRWSSSKTDPPQVADATPASTPETNTTADSADADVTGDRKDTVKPSRKGANSDLAEQNRLFEAARAARRAGQSNRALQLFVELMSDYPSSEQAHNARVEHFRLLRGLGRLEQAQRSARAYLRSYPNGFAAAEARELTQ